MTIGYMSDADLNAAFKRQFYKLQQNMFSTYGNVWGLINKTYGKGGDEVYAAIQNTFGGGVGASSDGTLPLANLEAYLEPNFQWRRVYANVELDGLMVAASRKAEHSFVQFAQKATINKMISFNRFMAGNVLFGDGTGALGQFSGSASGTAEAPVLTIMNGVSDTYQYRKGFWEKGDDVNVNSLNSVWRITNVNHDTRTITLSRKSGSDDLTAIGAGTHTVYMQNSKDVCPYGFQGIIDNSTHYNVPEEYRYAPLEIPSLGAELEDEMLVEMVRKFSEDTDEEPDVIVMPNLHFRRWLVAQEDKKRITMPAGRSNIGSGKTIAKVSYSGIALEGANKTIMVMESKYIKPGHVIGFVKRSCEFLGVGEKPGFTAFDGQTYLRLIGKDAYGAFLRCYGELFINPFHVCAITGLPTS